MRDSKRNLHLKNNFLNKDYNGPYIKSNVKNTQFSIDNETNKDTIIKLKEQIIAKDKEISDLKVSKIKKDAEYYKTMKILEDIVKEEETEINYEKKKNKKGKSYSLNNYNSNENTTRNMTFNFRELSSRDNYNNNENEEILKNEENELFKKKEEKKKNKRET